MTYLNLIVIKTAKLQEQADLYTSLGIQFDYHQHGKGPFHYVQDLVSKGVKILTPPASNEWGYTAIIEDWDGRKIELSEIS